MTTSNQGETNFTGLLRLYLQRQAEKSSNPNQSHLDEDILSAFVEGALTERQTTPVLRHLIDCVFCRRITAQLVELSESFEEVPHISNTAKTNNWSQMWNNLTESISRTHDNAVTAHEAEKDVSQNKEDESNKI